GLRRTSGTAPWASPRRRTSASGSAYSRGPHGRPSADLQIVVPMGRWGRGEEARHAAAEGASIDRESSGPAASLRAGLRLDEGLGNASRLAEALALIPLSAGDPP